MQYIPPHLKHVGALPWDVLKIAFHAIIQNMLLNSESFVLKKLMFHVVWLNRY